jgi:NADPH2 dehydrogenase
MKLTDQLVFGNLKARNRVIMSPMDTLMGDEKGMANDFHIQHYGSRAYGGVGTIIVEATSISKNGLIRPKDIGIWNDEQTRAADYFPQKPFEGLSKVEKETFLKLENKID